MSRVCAYKDCKGTPREGRSSPYCGAHEQRHRKGMDMDKPIRVSMKPSEFPPHCTYGDCVRGHYSAKLCQTHYYRSYYGRDMDTPRRYQPRVPGVTQVKTRAGYMLTFDPAHPAAYRKGFVLTHRLVMEKTLGRRLLPGETVHHKNGVKDDNRPENLELWASYQPAGQRVEDLVEHARHILALYGGA